MNTATKIECLIQLFTQRIINGWNNLPQEVVSAYSIASFKLNVEVR